jgi:hypothetical protein
VGTSPGDAFYEVEIAAVEATGEYDVVPGVARKKKSHNLTRLWNEADISSQLARYSTI